MRPLRYYTILLALFWLLAVPLVTLAQTPEATGTGITIEGQVTNAATGAAAPAGLSLMLHTYEGRSMTGMTNGVTNEQGRFRFANVETAPGRSFEVMVRYQDVTYFSELIEPRADQAQLDLPVTIRETTTDTTAVRVEQLHLLLDFTPGTVQISQVFILSNDGDRTVLSREGEGLRFHLPAGATDVTFEGDRDGTRFVQEEGGFLDTAPVVPGQGTQSTLVRYSLPYNDQIELEVPVDYPTANVSLLLPEVGVAPGGSAWAAGQELVVRKRVHQVYNYQQRLPLVPDDTLQVVVVGQPELSIATPEPDASVTPVADDRRQIFFVGVLLSLVLIGSGAIWWWRDRQGEMAPAPDLAPAGHDSEPEALETILQAIAALDDAHEAGAIDEAEYQEQRTRLRDQAVALMMAQK